MADPAISRIVETAAVGCLVGAGPPVDQLAVGLGVPDGADPVDLWALHCAVVRRANDIRRDELAVLHPHVRVVTVPEEVGGGD